MGGGPCRSADHRSNRADGEEGEEGNDREVAGEQLDGQPFSLHAVVVEGAWGVEEGEGHEVARGRSRSIAGAASSGRSNPEEARDGALGGGGQSDRGPRAGGVEEGSEACATREEVGVVEVGGARGVVGRRRQSAEEEGEGKSGGCTGVAAAAAIALLVGRDRRGAVRCTGL